MLKWIIIYWALTGGDDRASKSSHLTRFGHKWGHKDMKCHKNVKISKM